MHRSSRILLVVVLPLATLILGWQIGMNRQAQQVRALERRIDALYGFTQSGSVVGDPEKNVNIDLLWSVWRLLQSHYIDPAALDTDSLLSGAVHGLVSGVGDPYTLFMSPSENTDFRDSLRGQLEGIGAELTERQNQIVVVSPLKESPAEEAGLQPRDVILAVDGRDITGLRLSEVVSLIRGEAGTSVEITAMRENETRPIVLSITRETIRVPSVEYEERTLSGSTVGILTLNQFGADTVAETRAALQQAQSDALSGMVIDLRYNGGGYLEGAVDIASMFLRQGSVVTVEGRGEERQTHMATGRPILPDLPLAVLINAGTASASEIVAGALQDHDRAVIVGETSFGKGTVQEVIELPGGSSLRVTTAHWLTPSGRNLGTTGIEPDIAVEQTQEDIDAERDPQMDRAIEQVLR